MGLTNFLAKFSHVRVFSINSKFNPWIPFSGAKGKRHVYKLGSNQFGIYAMLLEGKPRLPQVFLRHPSFVPLVLRLQNTEVIF
jgi:hypothetical protein